MNRILQRIMNIANYLRPMVMANYLHVLFRRVSLLKIILFNEIVCTCIIKYIHAITD